MALTKSRDSLSIQVKDAHRFNLKCNKYKNNHSNEKPLAIKICVVQILCGIYHRRSSLLRNMRMREVPDGYEAPAGVSSFASFYNGFVQLALAADDDDDGKFCLPTRSANQVNY